MEWKVIKAEVPKDFKDKVKEYCKHSTETETTIIKRALQEHMNRHPVVTLNVRKKLT